MPSAAEALATYQDQTRRSLPVRLLNLAGTKWRAERLSALDLSHTALLHAAERSTGLSDWGDPSFRLPFHKLTVALDTEATLNPVGRYLFRQECLRLLTNRLELQAAFTRRPDILELPLPRPLFVVGMFRSGTTLLHNLLSQDAASRWLHVAEALLPSPAPTQAGWATDPRLKRAAKMLQFQNALSAGFSTAKHIQADQPAECSRLFEHAFVGHLFDFKANVPSFSDWLYSQDHSAQVEAYRYYRQQLQYLSSEWTGGHWCLKAPAHIFALDALLEAFPDANIVYIHRDPVVVLPSCCSLCALGRARYSDTVEPSGIGPYWLKRLAAGVTQAMHVRRQAPPERFYDVHYQDLVEEPVHTIRRLYEYFDYAFTGQMEGRMQAWHARNPQHRYGVHRYELEQFGLSTEEIRHQFASYMQTFGVRTEHTEA
jgi:hypothetical protein